jgi:hypothetical protein
VRGAHHVDIGHTAYRSQCAVKNYSGLLATRFFLGFAEAGVFPGSKCKRSLEPHVAMD